MPFRLRPRDTRLDPALARLCASLTSGAGLLGELLGADVKDQADFAERAAELDAEAEDAAHAVLGELASALVTPIDRVEVFHLVWSLRACARAVHEAVDGIRLLGVVQLPSAAVDAVQLVQLAADATAEAVPRIGRSRALTEAWIELTRLSKQASARHRESVAELTVPYSNTEPTDPLAVIRVLQAEDGLMAVMRAFERVGDVLQQIVVKEG